MANRDTDMGSTAYVPSGKALPGAPHNFRLGDKKRIIAEAMTPGASVSGVARRYGITAQMLKKHHANKHNQMFKLHDYTMSSFTPNEWLDCWSLI